MTRTTRTVFVAAVLALAVCTGAALGSAATTTTTTDGQTNETATVSFDDQQFDNGSVTIASATLPDGGFAVVYDASVEPIGHTEYLESGDHENVTVSLNESVEGSEVLMVTLYHNNGTEAYNASEDTQAYKDDNGVNVSDVAQVSSENRTRGGSDRGASSSDETTTDGATTDGATSDEETSDETTTEAAMDGESAEETTDQSSGGVPGFTPITAIVALLAAALVASRRR